MATTPPRPHPATAAVTALCWGPDPDLQPDPVERGLQHALGSLLELTIRHKLLCLTAYHAQTIDADLPRAVSRFLAGTLRANQYKTGIYRREAATITAALDTHHIPVAAMNGISTDTQLYGGHGARQFSDLDLLVHPDQHADAAALLGQLGYQPAAPGSGLIRNLPDILVPTITIDLTTTTRHARTTDEIQSVLGRRTTQSLPGDDQRLPVLATHDALAHTLVRLDQLASTRPEPPWAVCADALRLHRIYPAPGIHTTTPALRHGWEQLRRIWPQLPTSPFPAPAHPCENA